MIRINRYLAAAGLGSRRGVEKLIAEGRVKINGRVVEGLGALVAAGDIVKVGSKTVSPQEVVHAVLFKPKGVVCTAEDERGRPTIFSLLPDDWPRVYHVGRLDKESEGLLIVTNDGDLSLALTHPRFKVEKEYEVTLDRPFDPAHAAKLLKGFHIEGGRARMEEITQVSPIKIRVILTQGIKRQIRLMLYACGYEVENLRRTRIGTVRILKLRPGMWRMLSAKEISDLKAGRAPEQRPVPRKKAQQRPRVGSAQTGRAGQSSAPTPRTPRGDAPSSREIAGESAAGAVAGFAPSARPRRSSTGRRGPDDSFPRGTTSNTARPKRSSGYRSRPEGGPPSKFKGRS